MRKRGINSIMDKITAGLFFLMTLPGPSSAQTGYIRGTVGASENLREQIKVSLDRKLDTVLAGPEGNFGFRGVPSGIHRVELVSGGVDLKDTLVKVKPGRTTVLGFSFLSPVSLLPEIEVKDRGFSNILIPLPQVKGNVIYSGIRTDELIPGWPDGNMALNNSREILGRVPGLNITESAGNDFTSDGFGTRGLNPVQSVEMDIRQDGYNITADLYGYNEAYYNPPQEAVRKIAFIGGTSSLQFGPQFGGVMDFNMKKGDPDKAFVYRIRQTAGSFNLFNTFNSIAGTLGKWNYYAFLQYMHTDGWRPNSGSTALTGYGKIRYQASLRLGLAWNIPCRAISYRCPGGLLILNLI